MQAKQITIIGSNFAALAAINRLRNLDAGRHIEITVISPKAEFFYHPSLIWIPSGKRQGDDLKCDLKPYFARMGVNHHPGLATGVEDDGRTVLTNIGKVKNDGLLIASGATYLQKAPGFENVINPCSGLGAAENFRTRLSNMRSGGTIAFGFASNPQEPTALRGGPMFEFLFGTHTYLKKQGIRNKFKLAFFAPMPKPGQRLGPKAVKGLLGAMAKRDISTHLGKKISGFSQDGVMLEGDKLNSDLTIFIPGMTGPKWLANTGLTLSSGGFLQANAQCKVTGSNMVYAAGDVGSFPGPDWRAKQGHMAELQARCAANNLYAELMGNTPDSTFRNELICIVDTLDSGMLVSRFNSFNIILPPTRLMHFTKQLLEYKSFFPYRR
ncbi:MAG: NAD(P)/FAD-dependent oxidoreductase [Magnetococcales bacterium]|nr:NAD(P)/FAD-dependent oxidoreductase [Magnetococcales bacterium]